MLGANRIRRWCRLAVCGVLGVGAHSAVSQTSTGPAKPLQSSATPGKKSTSKAEAKKAAAPHAGSNRASSHGTKTARRKKVATKRGQQGIDSARAREIQTALIRQNYMKGEPSGTWDTTTQDAMRRYQADHGWQSKTIPDSRALIRLGLGPSSDHLLNPESAMTNAPADSDPKAAVKQTTPEDNLPKQ